MELAGGVRVSVMVGYGRRAVAKRGGCMVEKLILRGLGDEVLKVLKVLKSFEWTGGVG